MALGAYEQRLEREIPDNPLVDATTEKVFGIYRMELLNRINLFADISSKVLGEPYSSEVQSKVDRYLQSGALYKNTATFDKAIKLIKDAIIDDDTQEPIKEKMLNYFDRSLLEDAVIQRAKNLSKRAPLLIGPDMFLNWFMMSFTEPAKPSDIELMTNTLDEIYNPLVDFHDYMLGVSHDPRVAYEKCKGIAEIAQRYLKDIEPIYQGSYFLGEIRKLLQELVFTPKLLEGLDKRVVLVSGWGMVSYEEVDEETVGMLRDMFKVELNDKELFSLKDGLKSIGNKDLLIQLKNAVMSQENRTDKLVNFDSYVSYNRLAKHLGLPKLSLDEISQSAHKYLGYILKEKYRIHLTKKSINSVLRDTGLDDLFFEGELKPPESIERPDWENPNEIMRISLVDSGYQKINIDEISVDIPSIIGKAVKLTKKPKRFFHKNREVIERIKNGEYEIPEVKDLLSDLRSDLSESKRLHLMENEFLLLLGELDNDNLLKIAGVSASDNEALYLKWWERNFGTDLVIGHGFHCCFGARDIEKYLKSQNASIYEIWNNGYRFGGTFLLDVLNKDDVPFFTIDSIECHPRLFSTVSDRFGWDYSTSVKNVVNKTVKGVGLEAADNGRELIVASHSNQKEIVKVLEEMGKKYGSSVLKFDKENIHTDINFDKLPKQIDISKIEI